MAQWERIFQHHVEQAITNAVGDNETDIGTIADKMVRIVRLELQRY